MNLINPIERFGSALISVQNPSTYTGGEIGSIVKPHRENDGLFNFAMAFPDTYTIGMSNQAIKIIYQGLNKKSNIRCERVFCPEQDFEELLKKTETPLYTLETGMPLNQVDMIGFSVGYELGITGVLSVLDLGNVPLLKKDRGPDDPIVFAGGVGATNPAPFSAFFDAVFIGEAEGGMFEIVEKLSQMKKAGATRDELLAEFARCPNVWTSNMSVEKTGHSKAFRAVWEGFESEPMLDTFYPLPNIRTVQDHGVVEIMRGCPNGCRFCHAGVYYRPQRARSKKKIIDYCKRLVNEAGFREISLTSLSSADYPDVGGLLNELNSIFKIQNVSFQLPSLKVNSFTLPILEELGEVRKSGLTFAIETPDEAWQLRLNKEVYTAHLVELIEEAKKRGWNKAKFYFMVGLPFPETEEKTEEKVIVEFLKDIQERTKIQCHVNVGTFIPKPHTAYQWVRQISPEESDRKLRYIRENLPKGKFRVGTHDIATSFIEGLMSRGDERAGMVIYNAYKKGCRLDAWEDHLRQNIPLWEEAFAEAPYDVKNEILRERSKDEVLPWDSVSLGPSKTFYKREWDRNEQEVLTPVCKPDCDHKCGVCNNKVCVNTDKISQEVYKSEQNDVNSTKDRRQEQNIPVVYRAIFKFVKTDGAQFISHLSTVEIFNRAIQKSGFPVIYSAGFNPLPRLEFANTLSLGVESEAEIASLMLYDPVKEEDFINVINRDLARGMRITKAYIFAVTNQRRRESLSASLWGNEYIYLFKTSRREVEEFLASSQAESFIQKDSLCSFEFLNKDSNELKVQLVFNKDRPFRNALEDYFGKKLWEIVTIKKVHTFAKPNIMGWTAELNSEYGQQIRQIGLMKANDVLKEKVLQPEQNEAGKLFIDYFELYERIALVNKKLMDQRENQRDSSKSEV